jgi:AraC-like DNA-binding protein
MINNIHKNICNIRLNQKPSLYFCEPGWSWKQGPQMDVDIWCVLSGKGRVILGDSTYPIEAGTCWIFTPGSQPVATHDPKNPLTVLAVHLDFLDRDNHPLSEISGFKTCQPIQLPDARRLQLLAQFMVGTNYRGEDGVLAVWQLIHLLQHPEGQPADRVDGRLQKVIRRVTEQIAHPWTVAKMAALAGLSPSRFTALFREQLHQSPRQYVISLRMNRAETLLLESDLTQAEISEILGFNDVYFFNRQFTKHHGKSPGRFRKS